MLHTQLYNEGHHASNSCLWGALHSTSLAGESTHATASPGLIYALSDHMPKQLNSKPRRSTCWCAQVAAVSGDVRRCLELLRRAAEITEAKTKQAGASDAGAASSSGEAGPTGHAHRHCTCSAVSCTACIQFLQGTVQ